MKFRNLPDLISHVDHGRGSLVALDAECEGFEKGWR